MSTKLVLLSEVVAAQFAQNAKQSEGLELFLEKTWNSLLARCRETKVQVAVVELERMGEAPLRAYQELDASGVGLIIVTYSFAKRITLQELSNEGVRLMKAPLQLPQLRSQMMSIIVKDLLQGGSRG